MSKNSKVAKSYKKGLVTFFMLILASIVSLSISNEAKAFVGVEYQGFQSGAHNWGEGLQHVFLFKIYDGKGKVICWTYSYINYMVKPNGNGGWESTEEPKGDIRWGEMTAELLPLPNKPDSTGIFCKLPVYRDSNLAGYIVNTEFYSIYPDGIAYMNITSSQGIPKEALSLLPPKANSSLQVISQTKGKVVMEFDNADNVNTKFNVYSNGELIRQVDSKGNVLTIDKLRTGIYFIQCITDESLRAKITFSNY